MRMIPFTGKQTCTYFICLTIVLFPDSPAPETENKEGQHAAIIAKVKHGFSVKT